MSKTVFVLGAGFSAPAGMPVQADIMFDVLRAHSQPAQDTARKLYNTLFNMVDPDDMRDVPLENVFTMLDRANQYGEVIPGLSHQQIRGSLVSLVKAIVHEFNKKLRACTLDSYRPFFESLIKVRKGGGGAVAHDADPFSIITFNWDTIPDYMLGVASDVECGIDYACYDYDIDENTLHTPSILRKAAGLFTIKLLKPHGSLNWATCPSCGRLFAKTSTSEIPVLFPHQYKCTFCREVDLENVIITPTLVKDIRQTHLKVVWHNLQMDLQKAERIVFLGYSFPIADFEFRYTLLKSIITNKDVAIRVILYPPDDKITNEKERWLREQTEKRFLNFFGYRDIDIKYTDVLEFMCDETLIWSW